MPNPSSASSIITPRVINARSFYSAYAQGFMRCAVGTPIVHLADPMENAKVTIDILKQAHDHNVGVLVMPELNLSGYSIDDLLHQQALIIAVENALEKIISASRNFSPLAIIGAPLLWNGQLYNCGIVIHKGIILGVVPKSYLPNYREFYESRHFTSGSCVHAASEITLAQQKAPFGTDILFQATDIPDFILALEICEDLWVPIPPSSYAALAGANVIANLSASNALIGKSDARHALCQVQSSRCHAAYLYSAAGFGESTTDMAWDGQSMIYENGVLLAEGARFSMTSDMIMADVDLELLSAERMRNGGLSGDLLTLQGESSGPRFRRVHFTLAPSQEDIGLKRPLSRFPFVPDDISKRDVFCEEAFQIQAQGLAKRLKASKIENIVVGVSGGLDSAHALLVACYAMDLIKLPRKNILGYTLPAFATSTQSKSQACKLMEALAISASEIDITPSCLQMLQDIGHPAAHGKALYDITFENVQAGARSALLFRLANQNKAIVLGTGDLSEMALGWCTYGVGDQMNHYNVNASIPKTLIQHLIRWVKERNLYGKQASAVLGDILNSEISPELIPATTDKPIQKTQDVIGPYELQDFTLYYIIRYGMRPSKIAFLSWHIWRGASECSQNTTERKDTNNTYDLDTIHHWLKVFIQRFFAQSQFKRSAQPNGPKTISGGSLSPRGDWRMPSDSTASPWLAELARAFEK